MEEWREELRDFKQFFLTELRRHLGMESEKDATGGSSSFKFAPSTASPSSFKAASSSSFKFAPLTASSSSFKYAKRDEGDLFADRNSTQPRIQSQVEDGVGRIISDKGILGSSSIVHSLYDPSSHLGRIQARILGTQVAMAIAAKPRMKGGRSSMGSSSFQASRVRGSSPASNTRGMSTVGNSQNSTAA